MPGRRDWALSLRLEGLEEIRRFLCHLRLRLVVLKLGMGTHALPSGRGRPGREPTGVPVAAACELYSPDVSPPGDCPLFSRGREDPERGACAGQFPPHQLPGFPGRSITLGIT